MKNRVTLLVQKVIETEGDDEDAYQEALSKLEASLVEQGFTVNVEDEEDIS